MQQPGRCHEPKYQSFSSKMSRLSKFRLHVWWKPFFPKGLGCHFLFRTEPRRLLFWNLANPSCQAPIQSVRNSMIPISFLWFMKKQEATAACCPWKKEEEEIQEATVSRAAARNISADAGVAAVLSEMDGFFTLKEEKRTTLKLLLHGKDVFASFLTGSGKNLVKHLIVCYKALLLSPLAPTGSHEL